MQSLPSISQEQTILAAGKAFSQSHVHFQGIHIEYLEEVVQLSPIVWVVLFYTEDTKSSEMNKDEKILKKMSNGRGMLTKDNWLLSHFIHTLPDYMSYSSSNHVSIQLDWICFTDLTIDLSVRNDAVLFIALLLRINSCPLLELISEWKTHICMCEFWHSQPPETLKTSI